VHCDLAGGRITEATGTERRSAEVACRPESTVVMPTAEEVPATGARAVTMAVFGNVSVPLRSGPCGPAADVWNRKQARIR